jgi:uncharacterized membrane protein YphA (DoxX/SURF4 family)/uncharacterized membrane protein
MSDTFLNPSAIVTLVAIPGEVTWSYFVFALIFVIGLLTIFLRGYWRNVRGFDKVILFGPIFYAAPLAAFGTEHFTLTKLIASMVPAWIPWHMFWAYFVGACFIAAGLSFVTRIQVRLSATLVALTFFFFVALMDVPGWAKHPQDRFALALVLRELSFGAGAMALAASLTEKSSTGLSDILSTVARYAIGIAVLVYSFEQFRHADHVPGVPLEMVTPHYVFGHAIWTYLAAAVYAVAGVLLVVGKKTRAAATWVGLTILFVELLVYVPLAVVERTSLEGFNYMADTLMFCGAVLMLAGAMPREELHEVSSAAGQSRTQDQKLQVAINHRG